MSRQFKNGKCSCWSAINKQLKEYQTALSMSFTLSGFQYLRIETERTDGKKGRAKKVMLASYCPFCGSKLKKPDGS